ncbi:hypothetical protein BU16DRAFT_585508 [Lophium mytilinum]|uniref:Uncharacterized protein n=1 Tax=Lophium mytilinum TaxID=390894 RepID=A0A6A6QDX9_9PEZI|nr:hypothetical protein BU16DRAFT_585508 [Lophium mytilinum]
MRRMRYFPTQPALCEAVVSFAVPDSRSGVQTCGLITARAARICHAARREGVLPGSVARGCEVRTSGLQAPCELALKPRDSIGMHYSASETSEALAVQEVHAMREWGARREVGWFRWTGARDWRPACVAGAVRVVLEVVVLRVGWATRARVGKKSDDDKTVGRDDGRGAAPW